MFVYDGLEECLCVGRLSPQQHSAGSFLGGSFPALWGSHPAPSPGPSGSRGPP